MRGQRRSSVVAIGKERSRKTSPTKGWVQGRHSRAVPPVPPVRARGVDLPCTTGGSGEVCVATQERVRCRRRDRSISETHAALAPASRRFLYGCTTCPACNTANWRRAIHRHQLACAAGWRPTDVPVPNVRVAASRPDTSWLYSPPRNALSITSCSVSETPSDSRTARMRSVTEVP